MPRGARPYKPGTPYNVMFRGIKGKRIITDHADRNDFLTPTGDLGDETVRAIYASALLDNHVYVLLGAVSWSSGKHEAYSFRLYHLLNNVAVVTVNRLETVRPLGLPLLPLPVS